MPRYVILHHIGHPSKRDHYDWMLERDGRLCTWIVDRPDLAPGRAVQSFDHRLVYIEHEGPVSGDRGEVRRVASGTYEPIEWEERRIRIRLGAKLLTLTTRQVPGEGAEWQLSHDS